MNTQTHTRNITIHLPIVLQLRSGCPSEFSIVADSVRDLLLELEKEHAELYKSVCNDTGAIRRHINVFVNADHVRDLDGFGTKLKPGDTVTFLPAVSGG